jgi:hypothetical protein
MAPNLNHQVGMGQLRTAAIERTSASVANPGIASAVERESVSLPSWFPVDKAASILRAGAATFAFVTDRTGIGGTASLAELERAPRTKSVSFVAIPLGRALPLDTSPEEALARMADAGLEHLPIEVGGLIVGIVTRTAVTALLASDAGADTPLGRPAEAKATSRAAASARNPLAA